MILYFSVIILKSLSSDTINMIPAGYFFLYLFLYIKISLTAECECIYISKTVLQTISVLDKYATISLKTGVCKWTFR